MQKGRIPGLWFTRKKIERLLVIMQLSQMLLENGIDAKYWSRELGTKSIDDLQAELEAGETKLETIAGMLVRVVRVVAIVVRVQLGDKLFTLVEDKQIFFTGAVRQRGLKNIAEKIAGNETPIEAAQRALIEEIGLNFTGEWMFLGEEFQTATSPSYPGLNSCYHMFNYQIMLSAADLNELRFAEIRDRKLTLFTLEAI